MTKHKIFGYSAKCVESRSGDFIKGREYRVVGEGDTGAGGEISILGEEGGVRNVVWRGCLWGFERTESPTAIDQILGTEPDADGWIEWHGGECPVGEGVAIDTMQRGGIQTNNTQKDGRGARLWQHGGYISDIIAYRTHQPEQEEAPMTIEQLLTKANRHAAKAAKHEAKRQALIEQARALLPEGWELEEGGSIFHELKESLEQALEIEMQDPANWRAGDVVEVVDADSHDPFRNGDKVELVEGGSSVPFCTNGRTKYAMRDDQLKWISRPQ